ncbi:MAG TPA: hypothetical protein VMV45_18275, partial [Casimicrobiaceae bacterium]|nr:hypothetical protein [Casimicrobiaceae bacterium]
MIASITSTKGVDGSWQLALGSSCASDVRPQCNAAACCARQRTLTANYHLPTALFDELRRSNSSQEASMRYRHDPHGLRLPIKLDA